MHIYIYIYIHTYIHIVYIYIFNVYMHIHRKYQYFWNWEDPPVFFQACFVPRQASTLKPSELSVEVARWGPRCYGGVQTSRNKYMKMIESRVNFSKISMIFVSEWALQTAAFPPTKGNKETTQDLNDSSTKRRKNDQNLKVLSTFWSFLGWVWVEMHRWRFLFVMMIIFQHFWVASLQLEREESTVWKLVYPGLQEFANWKMEGLAKLAKLRILEKYFPCLKFKGQLGPSNASNFGFVMNCPEFSCHLQLLCPFFGNPGLEMRRAATCQQPY